MGVDFKLGADVGSFNMSINQAKGVLKGLNTEMKAAEAEYKATGNAEKLMSDKTRTLTSQLNIQKSIVDRTEKALDEMTKNGVNPADKAYQDLYKQLMTAQTGMYQAQAALNELGSSAQEAASGASQLQTSMNGISKKISLDQVISGIDRITSGLETAAKKAVSLGQDLWNALLTQARLADDTATEAQMWEIPLEEYKKRLAFHKSGVDTTLEAILTAESKMRKGIGKGSLDDELAALGIRVRETFLTDDEIPELESRVRDYSEVMWEAGQAILALGDDADKETKAQAIFGKSWRDLMDIFTKYKTYEEYKAAWQEMNVASDEATKNNVALSDSVAALETKLGELQQEVSGALAPGLTAVADSLSGVLDNILLYLQSEDGQKALADMSAAVSGLFESLGEIDPESVVSSFTTVFNGLIGGLQWLVENKDGVVTALKFIVTGWAGLKLAGGALQILNMINGIQGLGGGAAAAAEAGAATGASWGASFAAAVMKAVPWLVGLYTLLNPAATAGEQVDNLVDSNGKLTEAGKAAGLTDTEAAEIFDDEQRLRKQKETMLELTGLSEKQYKLLQSYWTYYSQVFGGTASDLERERYNMYGNMLLPTFEGQEAQMRAYLKKMQERAGAGNLDGRLDFSWFDIGTDGLVLKVSLEAPDDAASKLAAEVGAVTLPVNLIVRDGKGYDGAISKYANGIEFVPNTRLAWLHPGERVMTAQQNRNYTYNNHNYFGSVNLNNGLQIEQLTESIDRHNRRQMAGFGS